MKQIVSLCCFLTLCIQSFGQWIDITPPAQDISDYKFLTADVGLAATTDGIYRTLNGGQSWTLVNNQIAEGALFSKAGMPVYALGHNSTVLRSEDDGLTWDSLGVTGYSGPATQIEFPDSLTGYALIDTSDPGYDMKGLMLKTTDGGASWTALNTPASHPYFTLVTGRCLDSFHFFDKDRGFIPSADHCIYSTTDGGVSWTLVTCLSVDTLVPDPQFQVWVQNDSTAWVNGGALTTDRGQSWTVTATQDLPSSASYFMQKGKGIRIACEYISMWDMQSIAHASPDSGSTWVRVFDIAGNPYDNVYDLDLQGECVSDIQFINDSIWIVISGYTYDYYHLLRGTNVETARPEPQPQSEIEVFPVPFSDGFELRAKLTGDYSLSLTDLSGRECLRLEGFAQGELHRRIECPGLSPGLYILSMEQEGRSSVHRKVLKQ